MLDSKRMLVKTRAAAMVLGRSAGGASAHCAEVLWALPQAQLRYYSTHSTYLCSGRFLPQEMQL
jgi:hypothetical protein